MSDSVPASRVIPFVLVLLGLCLASFPAGADPGEIQFITKKFCVTGDSDGVNGWSFGFSFPGPPPTAATAQFNVDPVPQPAGPEELAQAFVNAVNPPGELVVNFGVCAKIDPQDPTCFTITLLFESDEPLPPDHWELAVGPQNLPPDCVVTAAGCTFNPTVFLLPPAVFGFACDFCEEETVTVCHAPPGNPSNAHTITIGIDALPAHLAHGDTEGACDNVNLPGQSYLDGAESTAGSTQEIEARRD